MKLIFKIRKHFATRRVNVLIKEHLSMLKRQKELCKIPVDKMQPIEVMMAMMIIVYFPLRPSIMRLFERRRRIIKSLNQ